jgi:aspartate aminotransferase
MKLTVPRVDRIKPSPSSMARQHARELRASGRDIVSLTTGEPDFDTPANVCEAAMHAMSASKTKYTDVGGTPELKAAIHGKFRRDNGLHYQASEIIVGAGAKQVIFNAFMATVDRGDEVIIPTPYWVSYPEIIALTDGTSVFAPCPPTKGFKLQPEDLERAISPRTKWLVLNSPNNPSGAAYTRAEMKALTEVLMRHPHVWVMSDDIYEHLLYDGREFVTPAQVEPGLKDRTLTVNGVSKAYAMTGWRIGYGGGPAALVQTMVKLQSQSTANPSSVGQAAATEALNGPQDIVEERTRVLQIRRDKVLALLESIPGLDCHRPEGAFYVFPSCANVIGRRTPGGKTISTDEDFILYLLDAENLALLHGAAYGVSPYFRISYAASLDTLAEGCERLRRACEALR